MGFRSDYVSISENVSIAPTNRSRKPVYRIGIALILAGSVGALGSVFLALPGLRFGIWYQSEPTVMALHAASAIVGLGLAVTSFVDPLPRRMLLHPFVVIPIAIALWSILTSPLHDVPGLTWFGSPQLGEGVFSYIDLALLVLGGASLRRFRLARAILAGTAIAVTVAVTALTAYRSHVDSTAPVPFFFPDYIAFYGILTPVLLMTLKPAPRPWFAASVFLLGLVVIAISENRAAIALALAVPPAAWLALRHLGRRGRPARWTGVAIVVAVAAGVTGAVFATGAPAPQDYLLTLESRSQLMRIALPAAEARPLSVLVGNGWGAYGDLLAIHLPVEWLSLFHGSEGVHWDAVDRVDFHSHNVFVESYLSIGVPGALLALAAIAVLPLRSRRALVPVATVAGALLAGVGAVWFQLPVTIPLVGLAAGFLAGPGRRAGRAFGNPAPIGSVLGLAAGVVGYAALSTGLLAERAYTFQPPMEAPLPDGPITAAQCPASLDDSGRGGLHLSFRLHLYGNHIAGRLAENERIGETDIAPLRGLVCAAESYPQARSTMRLHLTRLLMRADLAFAEPNADLDPFLERYLANWEEVVDALLVRAPRRTDQAAPYILWLLRENDQDRIRMFTETLYERAPDDPVALWFSGIALLGDPQTADEGLSRMRRALDRGIDRIVPVEAAIRDQLSAREPRSVGPHRSSERGSGDPR